MKKLKRIKIKNPVKHLKEKRLAKKTPVSTAVPYITNEAIAEHREEVLSGARKYIYPLQHSKHRIVLISTFIFIFVTVSFLVYSIIALYKLQNTSTFIYRVTQVVPFPVARAKRNFVSYESYLFELRHYMHYYESQQKLSFQTPEGQQQLADFKKRALERVVNDAYVKDLAKQHDVKVSNQEIDAEIRIVKEQNRLGTSDQVFEDVLRDFWGWSINDFKRSLRQQLLTRKLVSKLDTETHKRAEVALAEIKAGSSIAEVVKKYSEDATTKDKAGEYGALIDKSNRDIPPQITSAIFALKPGGLSEIINTGYTLEIVYLSGLEGDKARAAHVQFNFQDIGVFLKPVKDKDQAKLYIKS